MLSKSAVIILALIERHPLNAYEIIKMLNHMKVKEWYNVADSTVYATIKAMEKKEYIIGVVQKDGNMPDKTVYSLTSTGKEEVTRTISHYISDFDYDTIPFSIAGFFITILEKEKAVDLLQKRLKLLAKILSGITEQLDRLADSNIPPFAVFNIKRSELIVDAELKGTALLLETVKNTSLW